MVNMVMEACGVAITAIKLRPGREMGIAVKGSKRSRQPNFFIVQGVLTLLITKQLSSSPRAKRAGPKGPHAESARAVTGRRCPHSGVG